MKEYKISGKIQGKQRFAVIIFIMVIFFVLKSALSQYGLSPMTYVVPIILMAVAMIYMVIYYLFYRLHIKEDGFFCQTNPFNGKYYKYGEIEACEVIKIAKKFGSVHAHGVRETRYFYYFVFTDKSGIERKIQFDKALFEYEINVLKSRIEQAQRV